MSVRGRPRPTGYAAFYRHFDSPLMRQIRREAYGEDVGQHSWVGADDLRADVRRLGLGPGSRLLDLGCGPCGPLCFVLQKVGCSGTGLDSSPAALESGAARAAALDVADRLTLRSADLEEALPLASASFDAATALDVVIHLADRARLYREVARVLVPGGRFLVTDAGVVSGAISKAEMQARSLHGRIRLVPSGFNERALEAAGFRVLEVEDRTTGIVRNAGGRKAAMEAHRAELEPVVGAEELGKQLDYLEVVIALARRGALSRVLCLAERNR